MIAGDHVGTVRRDLGACARVLGDESTPRETIRTASGLGLRHVEFASPFAISPALDPTAFRALADYGRSLGVRLSCALGMVSAGHAERTTRFREAGRGDLVAGLSKALRAIGELDNDYVQVVVGTLDDRYDASVVWPEQLDATAQLYRNLSRVLTDLGLKLAVKTHEEITSHEILSLIDAVGSDLLAVALDPVNLPVRGEDPELATARLAPHVGRIHYDDAWITFTGRGLARRLCPGGQGDIDWGAIFRILDGAGSRAPVLVDLHRGEFEMPVCDERWLLQNSDVSLRELSILSSRARPDRPPVTATAPRLQAALSELATMTRGTAA